MLGGLFGNEERLKGPDAKERLKNAANTIVDGFGPRHERRNQSSGIKAVKGFAEAGAARKKKIDDSEEVAELRNLFGRKPAWDSTPFRPRPAALTGLLPITREPWAIDEDVYNKKASQRARSGRWRRL